MTQTTSSHPAALAPEQATAWSKATRKRTLRWVALAVVLFAVVATPAYFVLGRGGAAARHSIEAFVVQKRSFPVTLTEKGELDAKQSVNVNCEVEGRSTIIWLIAEGSEVKKGDLLVRLASNEIDDRVRAEQITVQNAAATAETARKELEITLDQNESDVSKAKLALKNAEIELNKYLEGDYRQQLIEKKLALEKAQKLLVQANDVLSDSKELREQEFITARELQQDELNAYEANINVEKAQLDLDIFEKYTYPKDKQQKESDVDEARKELDRTIKKAAAKEAQQRANLAAKDAEHQLTEERLSKLLEQQKKTEIRAPADGLVVYETGRHRWEQRQIAEGAEVYERQTLIKLPDTSRIVVKLRIHEANTSKIVVGQNANVEVEGVPGQTFTGKVTKIAPLADSQNMWLNPDLKEYDTEVLLDGENLGLKPGVTARATILIDYIKDVLAVPVQAVYSVGSDSYVFRGVNEQEAAPVKITVGTSSDEYVEVRDGLTSGDTVLLAVSDSLMSRLPKPVAEEAPAIPQNLDQPQQPVAERKTPEQGGERPQGGAGGGERPHGRGGGRPSRAQHTD